MTSSELRLCDLGRFDTLRVECTACGRVTEYLPGWRDSMGWTHSHGLLIELRFRCEKCQTREGFRVSILDERNRWTRGGVKERLITNGRPLRL